MAVPPRAPDPGLLMHVAIRVSATLRSMSHVVECLSFVPTAMAQFPRIGSKISAAVYMVHRVAYLLL